MENLPLNSPLEEPEENIAVSPLLDTLVKLRCYEPPWRTLDFSGDDLTRHTMLFGSTGSGKTTILNEIYYQLISYQNRDSNRKIGLLILDGKADDTIAKVKHFAAEVGRENDVKILSPTSEYYYDLLGGLQHFEDVEFQTQRIQSASEEMGRDNRFWTEFRTSMIRSALTLLLVNYDRIRFHEAVEFMSEWFFKDDADRNEISYARLFLEINEKELSQFVRSKLKQVLDHCRMWDKADNRLRSTVQATLTNVLQPLVSGQAEFYFGEKIHRFNLRDVIEKGAIMVVSINALNQPLLASLLLRVIKGDFYSAVQERNLSYTEEGRLTGIICDEFPLIATAQDVEQLQTIRSKRAFMIAASQGINSLDHRVGPLVRQSTLLSFNNFFFMKSNEPELDEFAETKMGTVRVPVTQDDIDQGKVLIAPRDGAGFYLSKSICSAGELGQLPQHHAFVSFADGRKTNGAFWVAPRFFQPPQKFLEEKELKLDIAPLRRRVEGVVEEQARSAFEKFLFEQTTAIMGRHGYKVRTPPPVFAAIAQLYDRNIRHEQEVVELEAFFRRCTVRLPIGIETLPGSWIRALSVLLKGNGGGKDSYVGPGISFLGMRDGVLLIRFVGEDQSIIENAPFDSKASMTRIRLQNAIYPSAYKNPSRRHLKLLRASRVDLASFFGIWDLAAHAETLPCEMDSHSDRMQKRKSNHKPIGKRGRKNS